MLVIVAYDIADKRRLRRVMKLMENYGSRRQKSVFECVLNERRFLALRSKMSELIDPEDDRVCYYHLCAACEKRIEGISEREHPVPKREDYVIV